MVFIRSTFALLLTAYPVHTFGRELILSPGTKIKEGRVFEHGHCKMIVQNDGNLIIKRNDEVTWTSEGKVPGSEGNKFFARMQLNGDFVVKSKGQVPVFRSYTKGLELSDGGGLYFEDNCDIAVSRKSPHDIIWSNVRSQFHCGDRLRKGEMFRYADEHAVYTLYLQHDGNLVIFEGNDKSDIHPNTITYHEAAAFSEKDEFYLEFTCDGVLELKEKKDDNSKKYEVYWSLRLVPESKLRGKKTEYSLTLPEGKFGYAEKMK